MCGARLKTTAEIKADHLKDLLTEPLLGRLVKGLFKYQFDFAVVVLTGDDQVIKDGPIAIPLVHDPYVTIYNFGPVRLLDGNGMELLDAPGFADLSDEPEMP